MRSVRDGQVTGKPSDIQRINQAEVEEDDERSYHHRKDRCCCTYGCKREENNRQCANDQNKMCKSEPCPHGYKGSESIAHEIDCHG